MTRFVLRLFIRLYFRWSCSGHRSVGTRASAAASTSFVSSAPTTTARRRRVARGLHTVCASRCSFSIIHSRLLLGHPTREVVAFPQFGYVRRVLFASFFLFLFFPIFAYFFSSLDIPGSNVFSLFVLSLSPPLPQVAPRAFQFDLGPENTRR